MTLLSNRCLLSTRSSNREPPFLLIGWHRTRHMRPFCAVAASGHHAMPPCTTQTAKVVLAFSASLSFLQTVDGKSHPIRIGLHGSAILIR